MAYLHSAALVKLLVVSFVAAEVHLLEDCSTSPEGITDDVVRAVCAFDFWSETAATFRNDTRSRHGVFDGINSPMYSIVGFFNQITEGAQCGTSCVNVSREDVTWCVMLADENRTIETCVSLDDNDELVFQSTCDAQYLELETYLTLPTASQCKGLEISAGCLGLTNLNWFFKDTYLTCIAETDNCRDVTFKVVFAQASSDQPPAISEITTSPLIVQPNEQIIIHAEVLSSAPDAFLYWHHDNTTYEEHIIEDPVCDKVREGDCGNYTHPRGLVLRSRRIRSYLFLRTINKECVESALYSLETYLIIDNATETDAGTYEVTVTTRNLPKVYREIKEVNVSIECDESLFFKVKCSNVNIAVEKGSNTKWECNFFAPSNSHIAVVHNKSVPVAHFDMDGKEGVDKVCASKHLTAFYDVMKEELHMCYSKFTVYVVICSVEDNLVGNYSVVWNQGRVAEGSGVNVKMIPSSQHLSSSDGKKGGVSPAVYSVPIVVLIGALVGIIILLVVLIRRRKRKRRQGHISTLQSPDPLASPDAVFYKKSGQFSPISLLSPPSASAAFSDPLEFPRNQLYVYTKKVLGEGSFGRVLQAKADGIVPGMPDRNIVAIKTTKENATSVEIEELLAELDLMRNMKPHENILNLLGQCTTPGGPVCLIVEYARYGNLRDFLRQCEEVVLSLNHKPHIPRHRSRTGTFSSSSAGSFQPLISRQDSSVFTPGSVQHQFVFPFPSPPSHKMSTSSSSSTTDSKATAHHPSTAMPLAHSVAPIGHDYINSKGLVYMEDVHNFALQIACGLQHLASMEIVHCDLAARNVLIAESFVLKIADFGLARDISGREMYKKNPRGKIPVKWTAPEALENRIFTTKSDVWSFGVVLWELFTYGHTPYPDLHLGQSYEAIISHLNDGNRMAQPESCSDEFYELMLKCWALDPEERPTPIDLVGTLTPLDGPCRHDSSDIAEVHEEDSKSNGVTQNGNQ